MKSQAELKDYVHQDLGQEITAIAGYYSLTKEIRLPFHGREVLYLLGYAIIDNSCCGAGSCSYALVPGFIIAWKYKNTKDSLPVSRVEPIRDQPVQKEIRVLIEKKEVVSQVNFQ